MNLILQWKIDAQIIFGLKSASRVKYPIFILLSDPLKIQNVLKIIPMNDRQQNI